jgi:hypothetical protein
VVPAHSLGEPHQLVGMVQRHGGSVLDPDSQRLTAAFLRHQDALICAHDVRALVHKAGGGKPAEARPVCRILLAHAQIPEADSLQVAQIALALATRLTHVPVDSISGTQEFIERLPFPPPAMPVAIPGKDAAPLHLLAAAGMAITTEEKTREISAIAPLAVSSYSRLTLRTAGAVRVLRADDCPVSIGRDRTCGFLVKGPDVSRVHGRITYAKGKFTYTDSSRNGTFVLMPGGNEFRLLNESIVLVAQGAISPGVPTSQQRGELIQFHCPADPSPAR